MAIAFTNSAGDGSRREFNNVSSGNFTFSHPGATGSNNIVFVIVATYRGQERAVTVSATYGGAAMTSLRKHYNNNGSVGSTTANTGFIQIFALQNVSTSSATVQVSWVSTAPIQDFYISADSYSYSGVNNAIAAWTEQGTETGTLLYQFVASEPERHILQVFSHEPLGIGTQITDYTQTILGELDAGYCTAIVGEAPGASTVEFQAERQDGADYAGVAVEILPYDPMTLEPAGASLTITGGTPTVTAETNTYVYPQPATLTITGDTPFVHAPLIPGPANLTITGEVPSVDVSGQVRPVGAMLTITGGTPAIRIGEVVYPTAAALTLTMGTPEVRPGANLFPAPATMTITMGTPWIGMGLSVIPSSATVLSLKGLNYDEESPMPNFLQGRFALPPYTMEEIKYPASFKKTSIDEGVTALDAALRATAGQKIVLGHSQGAQVCARWMREFDSDPTAPDESELMFILTGNPLRATGGYIIDRPEVGGEIGIPTPLTTRWNIVDVARRWDGFADWVTSEDDKTAVQNARSGMSGHHTTPAYDNVDIYDPGHTVWNSGNTTFILTQEERPPLLRNWLLLGDQGQAVTLAYMRHIEKTYTNRPPNDPEIVVDPEPNSFWATFLSLAGIDYS